MTIIFKPTKVRKSFFTSKAIWVAGIDVSNKKYVKGLIHKGKPTFIEAIKRANKQQRALVVSLNITQNIDQRRSDLIWFNPGNQEIHNL